MLVLSVCRNHAPATTAGSVQLAVLQAANAAVSGGRGGARDAVPAESRAIPDAVVDSHAPNLCTGNGASPLYVCSRRIFQTFVEQSKRPLHDRNNIV